MGPRELHAPPSAKAPDLFGWAFASPFSQRGQPAEPPWKLALVTIMQFAENLSDRQAADAVRGRIDWKYALSLELTDPGFDYTLHAHSPVTIGNSSRPTRRSINRSEDERQENLGRIAQ